jgi:hypothetical protein
LPIGILPAGSVADQTAGFSNLPIRIYRWHGMACRQRDQLVAVDEEQRVGTDEEGVGPLVTAA